MNQFVSGESDAKGLSVILPYIAVGPAAVAIRRPELLEMLGIRPGSAWHGAARPGTARQGKDFGKARHGQARPGTARQGTWAGVTTSKHKTHTEQGIQHNTTLDTCTRKTTQSH